MKKDPLIEALKETTKNAKEMNKEWKESNRKWKEVRRFIRHKGDVWS